MRKHAALCAVLISMPLASRGRGGRGAGEPLGR
jgi:hypothetical protein